MSVKCILHLAAVYCECMVASVAKMVVASKHVHVLVAYPFNSVQQGSQNLQKFLLTISRIRKTNYTD